MKNPILCSVVSLGCPKNLVDSEQMLGLMVHSGFELTSDIASAEVIVVNTCGFLQSAVNESLNELKRLAKFKKKGKCKVLIAAGCLVSRYPDLVRQSVKEVDECIGALEVDRIHEVVANALKIRLRRQEILAEPPYIPRIVSTPSWYAYMKIAEGCDRVCSFCTIPFIRGKQKSRPIRDLLAEAKEMVEQGVKEIILIAQDTTRYGIDLYGRHMLPDLLRQIASIDGLKWIRLLYCYPTAVSDRLIEAMAESDRIGRYIDIPLQHICPEILRSMQRGGDSEFYLNLIEKLRTAMPDIAIRTTFIVGFPGETDKHFEHLLNFVKTARFDRLGVFVFSPERGTVAAALPDQVPKKIAEERKHILLTTQQKISVERNATFIGKDLEVVIERFDYRNKVYEARSQYEAPEIDGNVLVKNHTNCDGLVGKFVNVKITKADIYELHAEFLGKGG